MNFLKVKCFQRLVSTANLHLYNKWLKSVPKKTSDVVFVRERGVFERKPEDGPGGDSALGKAVQPDPGLKAPPSFQSLIVEKGNNIALQLERTFVGAI